MIQYVCACVCVNCVCGKVEKKSVWLDGCVWLGWVCCRCVKEVFQSFQHAKKKRRSKRKRRRIKSKRKMERGIREKKMNKDEIKERNEINNRFCDLLDISSILS